MNCGRTFGDGRSCQFCKQVEGLPRGVTVANPLRRLWAFVLDLIVPIIALLITFVVLSVILILFRSEISAANLKRVVYVALIVILTLTSIVCLVWQLILYRFGQSLGKYLLGIRVVRLNDARAAGIGTMVLRDMIAKPVINLLGFITLGIVNFWLIWDKDTQELWDKVVGTIVVNDASKLTVGSADTHR